ncbi:MAG TPA: hypothetical protein VEY07_06090 [Thermoplasmata archaeon]|nr:hypothetical protein [Thermoplasmata archaeon]
MMEGFDRPTSVIICGSDRPLLNWIAFALAGCVDPRFAWTDVQMEGEQLDPLDPLSRHLIPPARFDSVTPFQMGAEVVPAGISPEKLIRPDERGETVRHLADFIRLPAHTQERISQIPSGHEPAVLVLSNGHRLVALYPSASVGRAVGAIVSAGATLIMTFADAPPAGRLAFSAVVHVSGRGMADWREATLRVEKGGPVDGVRAGSSRPLGELPTLGPAMGKHLD